MMQLQPLQSDDRRCVVDFPLFYPLVCLFPAYHMNKASWITAALDGSVSVETIELLLDVSYELTKPKIRRKTANRKESDDTKI